MNALSLKGFLTLAGLAALVAALVLGGVCALVGWHAPGELALAGVAAVMLGLMTAGVVYLVQLARDLRNLHLPASELAADESVLLETPGSVVHSRTGRPGRFWESVGGKLVLTTHRLVFLAHRGQPWHYRLSWPRAEIADAAPVDIFGTVPGGLRVTTHHGRQELFLFGAVRASEATQWARAIRRNAGRSAPAA